jgi:uncharacterized protein YjbI with pentapeptide repeats
MKQLNFQNLTKWLVTITLVVFMGLALVPNSAFAQINRNPRAQTTNVAPAPSVTVPATPVESVTTNLTKLLETKACVGCDLTKASFKDTNLQGFNLENANLRGASLERANLQGTNLKGANLQGVDLEKANLQGANLAGANLFDADLEKANLSLANLTGANLQKADLGKANLTGTNLEGVDLRGADWEGATGIAKITIQSVPAPKI